MKALGHAPSAAGHAPGEAVWTALERQRTGRRGVERGKGEKEGDGVGEG